MEFYIEFVGVILAALIILFGAIRTIEYFFSKMEDKRRYDMLRGYTTYARHEVQFMAKDMIKEINDNVFGMIKKWTDEL